METIMKIPFLLAMLAAIITGLISIMYNASINTTCIRMIVALIGFYILGLIVRSTLTGIIEEKNKQKQEEEKQRIEQLKLEEAAKLKQEGHLGNNLDLVTDSKLDDGFSPLDLSQAIRTKVKE